jgi:serine/threonine protein kinase
VHDVYELDDRTKEGQLGSGSYGTVCVARHRKTGEKFACKQLKLNRATPRYVSKLYHEVTDGDR